MVTRKRLPGDATNRQSRYIEAAVNGILFSCIYLPNGNPQPGPRFAYKLAWFKRLISLAAELLSADVPVVLASDFNVVPTELDIYSTRSWMKNALLQPESRAAYRQLLDQGWTDYLWSLRPDARIYIFQPNLHEGRERDAGLRLDHLLLSPKLRKQLQDAGVDRSVRGEAGASDHVPTWITLREQRK